MVLQVKTYNLWGSLPPSSRLAAAAKVCLVRSSARMQSRLLNIVHAAVSQKFAMVTLALKLHKGVSRCDHMITAFTSTDLQCRQSWMICM